MTTITITRTIYAPIQTVFRTVADVRQFSKAVPGIVRVDFLSETKSGVGTRFRETRMMRRKEASTDLEVTEYVENDRVRIVADTGGTVWDTLFTVVRKDGATVLTMYMEVRSDGPISKLINKAIRRMVKKAIEQDMDSVKRYCEKGAWE